MFLNECSYALQTGIMRFEIRYWFCRRKKRFVLIKSVVSFLVFAGLSVFLQFNKELNGYTL